MKDEGRNEGRGTRDEGLNLILTLGVPRAWLPEDERNDRIWTNTCVLYVYTNRLGEVERVTRFRLEGNDM